MQHQPVAECLKHFPAPSIPKRPRHVDSREMHWAAGCTKTELSAHRSCPLHFGLGRSSGSILVQISHDGLFRPPCKQTRGQSGLLGLSFEFECVCARPSQIYTILRHTALLLMLVTEVDCPKQNPTAPSSLRSQLCHPAPASPSQLPSSHFDLRVWCFGAIGARDG